MKKIFIAIILLGFIPTLKAQYYFDFNESSSFYNHHMFLQAANISKETVIIGEQKNDVFEDSVKIFLYNINPHGDIASIYFGSKWNTPVLVDSFVYKADGSKTTIPFSDLEKGQNKDSVKSKTDSYITDFKNATYRYEYDSINRIKKVFRKQRNYPETLSRLVYYDEQNRVIKIDFAPQSESVRLKEYVYKKNKVKIYSTNSTSSDCNEVLELNGNKQISNYEITLGIYPKTITYDYEYSYNGNGLVSFETKKLYGKIVSMVTHHYYYR